MRSDVLQVLNLTSAELRPEHAQVLHQYLDPAERVTAIWTVTLTTPTCLCMTTARLLVVDGLRGNKVRGVARDTGIQMQFIQNMSGFNAQFIAAGGVLELKNFKNKHMPMLQSFFAAGDRDASLITPEHTTAPPAVRRLVAGGLDYVDTLIDVLVRHGLAGEFIGVVSSDDLPLVEDHAMRFFVMTEALLALGQHGQADSPAARQFYSAFTDWFLTPAGNPSVTVQFASYMQQDQQVGADMRAETSGILANICEDVGPEDAFALRHRRAKFLGELYAIHGLRVPAEDAMPMAPPQNGATARPPEPDMVARLRELAEMRGSGLLSEEEFTAAKARLLQG